MYKKRQNGFTLIEILVVIGIIGILSSIILVSVSSVRIKARDAKRKAEISSIGRMVTLSCYTPSAGPGKYDIADLFSELVLSNPQYASYASQIPKDPSASLSGTKSLYMYIVDGNHQCAVYANLENQQEPVTLQNATGPTPGGGTGVTNDTSDGWNGTSKYFQVSN